MRGKMRIGERKRNKIAKENIENGRCKEEGDLENKPLI